MAKSHFEPRKHGTRRAGPVQADDSLQARSGDRFARSPDAGLTQYFRDSRNRGGCSLLRGGLGQLVFALQVALGRREDELFLVEAVIERPRHVEQLRQVRVEKYGRLPVLLNQLERVFGEIL